MNNERKMNLNIKSEKGITLVTVIIMLVIMTIIASVSIIGGVSILRESKEQVDEANLAAVKAVVNREAGKAATSGVLTPANATFYGVEDAILEGTAYSGDGTTYQIVKNIGENWYFLDEDALRKMGVEYAEEEYVVNYKLNVVIPLSSVENIHEQIEVYNAK